MVTNRISHELSQEAAEDVMAHLAAIEEALPFLVGLKPTERRKLLKAGDRSDAFIRKAADIGQMISGHLPRSLDLAEMRKDMALRDALYPIMVLLSQLAEKLADTYALANSEAYGAALAIYRSAKLVKGDEGLEQAVAELGRRFGRRSSRSATEVDSSASA